MSVQRYYPSCGLILNPENGPEVVVAGYGTSEIFNLASQTWREGPVGPYFYNAGSAQLADTFLAVGGFYTDYLDTVYEFDPVDYAWTLRNQRLSSPRWGPGTVALPRGFVQC